MLFIVPTNPSKGYVYQKLSPSRGKKHHGHITVPLWARGFSGHHPYHYQMNECRKECTEVIPWLRTEQGADRDQ